MYFADTKCDTFASWKWYYILPFQHCPKDNITRCKPTIMRSHITSRKVNITDKKTIAFATVRLLTNPRFNLIRGMFFCLKKKSPLLSREWYYFPTNKSRRSLVYHQFRRNCISSIRSVAYHQAAGNTAFGWWYAPTAMIYTLTRDDMPSLRLG